MINRSLVRGTITVHLSSHAFVRRAVGGELGVHARGRAGLHGGGGGLAGPLVRRGARARARLLHTHVHAASRLRANYGVALPRGAYSNRLPNCQSIEYLCTTLYV